MNQLDKAYAAIGPPVTPQLKQNILNLVHNRITPQTLSSFLWKDNVIDGSTILRSSARLPNGQLIITDTATCDRILRGLKKLNIIHPIKFAPGSFAPWIGIGLKDTDHLETDDQYCESYWSYRVLVDVQFDNMPNMPDSQPTQTTAPPRNDLSTKSSDDLRLMIAEKFPQPIETWLERFEELKCGGKEPFEALLSVAYEAYDIKTLRKEYITTPAHKLSKSDLIRELFKTLIKE